MLSPWGIKEDAIQAQTGPDGKVRLSPKVTDRFQRFLNDLMTAANDYAARLSVLETTSSATFSGTPSGAGLLTIPHTLGVTPTRYSAQTVGSSFAVVNIDSVDATNLVVKLFDAAGAAITSGTWSVRWYAAK